LKLLFDANLSPQLVGRLAELFPNSQHVFESGLGQFISDQIIWDYARTNGFIIVTADSDFLEFAKDRAAFCNCGSQAAQPWAVRRVEYLLRRHALRIAELEQSSRPILIIRNTP
jgi:predicted nuclease of predicted toxin-antitoxin system